MSRCHYHTEHRERVALVKPECRNVGKRGIEEHIYILRIHDVEWPDINENGLV